MNRDSQRQAYEGYFPHAIGLYEALGNSTLADGRTLFDSLKVVGDVSLWSCLSTYLILYRFPLCFEKSAVPLSECYRPYIGGFAQLRDRLFSIGRYSTEGVKINHQSCDTSTVLLLQFSEYIYQSVLSPIHQKLTTGPSSLKVVALAHDRRSHTGNCYSVLDFCTSAMKLRRAIGFDLIKKLTDPILELATKANLNVKYADQINRDALRRELHWLCTREFPRLVTLAASAYEVMESIRPSLILTGDDADQKCKLFELIGASYSIPSLVVQQGFSRPDYPDWKYFAGHHVAVMGPSSVEVITAQGVPVDHLTVTGHPGFDQYVNLTIDEVIDTRRSLGLATKESFIFFASQPYLPNAFKSQAARDDMIKSVLNASECLTGIRLVIKPHPNDNVAELKRLCEGFANVMLVDGVYSTPSLIRACDVFVTMFSQATFEALYANKPVININFLDSGIKAAFLSKGATLVACTENEVMEAFKAVAAGDFSFFQSEARHTAAAMLLRDWVFIPDGCAGDRVVELIQKLYLHMPAQQGGNELLPKSPSKCDVN